MKRFAIIGVVLALTALKAASQDLQDSLSYVYTLWSAEQRKVMLMNMDLTESEKSAFVPVYDTFARIAGVLEVERLELLSRYTMHSDSEEDELVKLYEKILQKDLDLAKLRRQYYRKFLKVLSSTQASEFMALDESLRAAFYLELQRRDPAVALSEAAILSLNRRYPQAIP